MRVAFQWLIVFLALTPIAEGQDIPLRMIEIDPAHPHLSAIHQHMIPGLESEVHIYAPMTPELAAHLGFIADFNQRTDNPTHWSVRLYAGPDYLQEVGKEPPGNVVFLSGRNNRTVDYILAALQGGQHVLADKPWVIRTEDLPKLESALRLAAQKKLIAFDEMTQRFDVAYQLQRELVNDPSVFGDPVPGTEAAPAVHLENLHALLKFNGKTPLRRPASFLDVDQQGEGMADVGTHLVDLVFWTLARNQAIDYRRDIRILKASREPVLIQRSQFERLTGQAAWPTFLTKDIQDDTLHFFGNNTLLFQVRGVHVSLRVRWQYEAPPGDQDTYFSSYQGSLARIELREGAPEHFISEVRVFPSSQQNRERVKHGLERAITRLQSQYPGLRLEEEAESFHIVIPPATRHNGQGFALLVKQFLGYVHDPSSFPAWEIPNEIAKYYVTTSAVALGRQKNP